MEKPSQDELERFIHAELRRLPEVAAPSTLQGRVLAALAEEAADAARPWWRRAWWNWPALARAGSLVVFLLLGGGICSLPWTLSEVAALGLGRLQAAWESLGPLLDLAVPLLNAVRVMGEIAGQHPWVLVGLAMTFLTYLFLVGVGTFYVRLACLHAGAAGRHDG